MESTMFWLCFMTTWGSHLNATKGQRSASPNPVCCFEGMKFKWVEWTTEAVILSSVWTEYLSWGPRTMLCTCPFSAFSVHPGNPGNLPASKISRRGTSILKQPEAVMSVLINSFPWEHSLCLQREFRNNPRFVPWGSGLWNGLFCLKVLLHYHA